MFICKGEERGGDGCRNEDISDGAVLFQGVLSQW